MTTTALALAAPQTQLDAGMAAMKAKKPAEAVAELHFPRRTPISLPRASATCFQRSGETVVH